MLRYSAILIISALYFTLICTSPLPLSFLFIYSLSMSAFGRCILYIVSIFLVFLSISFISSVPQLIIPELYLNIGSASDLIIIIFIIIIISLLFLSSSTLSFYYYYYYCCHHHHHQYYYYYYYY